MRASSVPWGASAAWLLWNRSSPGSKLNDRWVPDMPVDDDGRALYLSQIMIPRRYARQDDSPFFFLPFGNACLQRGLSHSKRAIWIADPDGVQLDATTVTAHLQRPNVSLIESALWSYLAGGGGKSKKRISPVEARSYTVGDVGESSEEERLPGRLVYQAGTVTISWPYLWRARAGRCQCD